MAPSPSNAATTSVQVALRIRPTTTQDTGSIPARFQRTVINAISPTTISVDSSSSGPSSVGSSAAAVTAASAQAKKQTFTFDQVHPPATTQYDMYTTTAQPLISRFIDGYNCTILAYGQTSSGKTFTMTGIDLDGDPGDSGNGMGIIPRAVHTVFSRCREQKETRGGAWNYSIKGSFIEIYNEDLIDLLSIDEGGGGRREVVIREDKQGHILWEGLREVNVKSAGEVMSLIRQGTSIRRTNETEMNAQSSRSHAIFSLTLTQKKFVGSTPPPRSSSPLPPGGRSPSRLARPGSVYSGTPTVRVSSPTFQRSGTPTFTAALGRGGGRPASSLGFLSPDAARSANASSDDQGEWVTVVSKFHFVDLAGSERLKRTAAVGERVKEGISINSGLLALGNVISALGDPARAKSHTASYVPYRDSKLTRLLQDSLGGNAHTLMIACVSPAEWNANETINTLKYANRARNIKNRAVVNEKEEGWDDIEWLQGMVTRLRKEVKGIKEGGAITGAGPGESNDVIEGAGKKVLAQMSELQNNYEDLREKFVERTEELTRLRRDLSEKQRTSKGGHVGGTAKYEEIVGPVIEEYEKTISAMEAELSLNRAALRHTNEMVEEREAELSQLSERHVTTELYVEELRSRVAKLSEREASTEAYVHDLEEKVKLYDETNMSSSGSITDLKREIVRFKDSESHSIEYIADLEARLARADESVLALRETVERLEGEGERRRLEVEALLSRLESLKQDGQSWRTDLEQRERKVRALEIKMEQWEAKKKEAAEDRERLGGLVTEVAKARQQFAASSLSVNTISTQASSENTRPSTPSSLEGQLVALQQTHTATLADLSSVSGKYRDALREIADLAAQLQEAKVSAPIQSQFSESPERPTPLSTRRRMTRGMSRDTLEPQLNGNSNGNGNSKRLFFRQAASAESLHSRSLSQSLSLSQELSSVRSRQASISSHGTSSSTSHSPSGSRPNLSISLSSVNVSTNERSVGSLEKEIMRLQDVLKEREAEITSLEDTLKQKENEQLNELFRAPAPDPSVHLSATPFVDDSVTLAHLSPKTMNHFKAIRNSLDVRYMRNDASPDDDESLDRLNELMRSMAQKESSHHEEVDQLNAQLSQVRKLYEELNVLSRDQTLNMSTELEALRTRHDEELQRHNEDLAKLEQLEQRETELLTALDRAEAEYASAAGLLKAEHEEALRAKEAEVDTLLARTKDEHDATLRALHEQLSQASDALADAQREHRTSLDNLREQLLVASEALDKAHLDHQAAFGKLQSDHETELRQRSEEVADTIEHMRKEHEAALSKLTAERMELLHRNEEVGQVLESTRKEHDEALAKKSAELAEVLKQRDEEASATLQRTEEEYYNALTKLRADHAEVLEKLTAEGATALERLRDEHARDTHMSEIARDGSITESQSARDLALKELQDAHAAAFKNKEALFASDLQKLKDEHAQALVAKEAEYFSNLERTKSEHTSSTTKKEAAYAADLERIQGEHADAISRKEAAFAADLERLKADHARVLSTKEQEHSSALESVTTEYSARLAKLQESTSKEIERLTSALEDSQTELSDLHSTLRADADVAVQAVKEQQAVILLEVGRSHTEEVAHLEALHVAAAEATAREAEEQRTSLIKSHTEQIATLRAEHENAIAELQAVLIAAQEQHQQDMEESRLQADRLLTEEKERIASIVADLEGTHAQEMETRRKDHALILDELEAYKAASDKAALAQEETRRIHEAALLQKDDTISTLQAQLSGSNDERATLASEVERLRAELQDTRSKTTELVREASKRESLVDELERHRSELAEMQENLQRTKDDMDMLQAEKNRQDSLLRDLQAQLVRSPTMNEGLPMRPPNDRNISFSRGVSGLPTAKLPPPTPPPNVPPPPAPRSTHESTVSMSTNVSGTSSRMESILDSPNTPATSLAHSIIGSGADPKHAAQMQTQVKQIKEQDAMIKTLTKQLEFCESELQSSMDTNSTLQTSAADLEKNLRKARMQATELARERDNLIAQITTLRTELHEAKTEVVSVRRSVVEEKQSLESKLDEERRAKERARAQLDSRMDELQRRKSKFVCL